MPSIDHGAWQLAQITQDKSMQVRTVFESS